MRTREKVIYIYTHITSVVEIILNTVYRVYRDIGYP